MKTKLQIQILTVAALVACQAQAGVINVTFDNVPPDIQCGEFWTNNGVTLSFNGTVASEIGYDGSCFFGLGVGLVWLYPSRLVLDFSQLPEPVVSIVATGAAAGNTGMAAYLGTNKISQILSRSGTLSLNFTTTFPDHCAIFSSEGNDTGVTLTTTNLPPALSIAPAPGGMTITWPSNQNSFVLQRNSDFTNPSGWVSQTNNIQFNGVSFQFNVGSPVGAEFFRLVGPAMP